jgi:hypothetical protein
MAELQSSAHAESVRHLAEDVTDEDDEQEAEPDDAALASLSQKMRREQQERRSKAAAAMPGSKLGTHGCPQRNKLVVRQSVSETC